jgi:hypothetical protein
MESLSSKLSMVRVAAETTAVRGRRPTAETTTARARRQHGQALRTVWVWGGCSGCVGDGSMAAATGARVCD